MSQISRAGMWQESSRAGLEEEEDEEEGEGRGKLGNVFVKKKKKSGYLQEKADA